MVDFILDLLTLPSVFIIVALCVGLGISYLLYISNIPGLVSIAWSPIGGILGGIVYITIKGEW